MAKNDLSLSPCICVFNKYGCPKCQSHLVYKIGAILLVCAKDGFSWINLED
jgi:hypothetical protein